MCVCACVCSFLFFTSAVFSFYISVIGLTRPCESASIAAGFTPLLQLVCRRGEEDHLFRPSFHFARSRCLPLVGVVTNRREYRFKWFGSDKKITFQIFKLYQIQITKVIGLVLTFVTTEEV